jgi:hypothetical protein
MLMTCEQRDAETPGQAWTLPVRTCQPTTGSNRAGSSRGVVVDAACECRTKPTHAQMSTKPAMSGKRRMLLDTLGAVA